ncbi:MAG: hypothetical protein ATN31_09055 [Candidatus Epulonipiscioides saccharophilum]|nr:MAG: hypothetical protein ATN31_09055 [Epulopiscium sp. AS2M-Bin001]
MALNSKLVVIIVNLLKFPCMPGSGAVTKLWGSGAPSVFAKLWGSGAPSVFAKLWGSGAPSVFTTLRGKWCLTPGGRKRAFKFPLVSREVGPPSGRGGRGGECVTSFKKVSA